MSPRLTRRSPGGRTVERPLREEVGGGGHDPIAGRVGRRARHSSLALRVRASAPQLRLIN